MNVDPLRRNLLSAALLVEAALPLRSYQRRGEVVCDPRLLVRWRRLCIARALLVCVELGGSWSEPMTTKGVVSLTTPSSGSWGSYGNSIELSLSINSEF